MFGRERERDRCAGRERIERAGTERHLHEAFVLAGQRAGTVNALAQRFGLSHKALISVRGEPLITYVARTLAELDDVAELWQPVLERFVAVVRGEDPRPTALPLV